MMAIVILVKLQTRLHQAYFWAMGEKTQGEKKQAQNSFFSILENTFCIFSFKIFYSTVKKKPKPKKKFKTQEKF